MNNRRQLPVEELVGRSHFVQSTSIRDIRPSGERLYNVHVLVDLSGVCRLLLLHIPSSRRDVLISRRLDHRTIRTFIGCSKTCIALLTKET